MNGKAWSKRERDFVRDYYGDIATKDIADAVERTIDQVRDMARKLGVTRTIAKPRPWTEEERAILRRDYGQRPASEIAAALGRTLESVYRGAHAQGLGNRIRSWTDAETDTLRRLNAAGWPDTRIAEQLGRDRRGVCDVRRRMNLPHNGHGEMARKAVSAGVKRQCERLGLTSPTELRTAAFRKFAIANGWPEDLRPREVQILNALAARGVPMTRLELAAAIGMRTDRMGANGTLALLASCNGPGGTYTASLMRRGMLVKILRAATVHGQGKGRSRDLYFLGPAAITCLETRACQSRTADSI